MRVAILGGGAWGTVLAKLAAENGHETALWARDPMVLRTVREHRENQRHLPGVQLPETIRTEPSLRRCVEPAEALVVAIPSRGFREVLRQTGDFRGLAVSVTKGIEYHTGLTMAGILNSELPEAVPAVLSGPTIAQEVAAGKPAAGVVASRQPEAAATARTLFHRPTFRVYSSTDLIGVELGGALKNVIAIAAGVVDGLALGDNTKAALITRGVAEISRLGIAAGANGKTFSGLSGLGDLTVTCFSPLSRNRTFGEELGKGQSVDDILAHSQSVVEGIPTSRSAHRLARQLQVETPIVDEVYAMLYQKKPVADALKSLLGRDTKPED